MFKVGQKVRVKKWLDMPQELKSNYGINDYSIGAIGVVGSFWKQLNGINSYHIMLKGAIHFAFEPELELPIKIGEQLLLFEL